FSPGRPSDENMAALIQPQSNGVRCIRPPEIVDATQTTALFEQTDEVEECRGGDAVVENLHENAAQCRVRVDLRGNRGRCSDCEESKHAVTEVIDGQISNHPFQIPLSPCSQRSEHNRTDR